MDFCMAFVVFQVFRVVVQPGQSDAWAGYIDLTLL